MCPAPKTKTSTTDTTNPNAKNLDASQSPMSSMNLETCTPDALAEYLLHNRFANDETKALAFLQAATKAVPKSSGSSLDAASPPPSDLPAIDLGDALLEDPLETSLIAPRAGKFRIQFHQNGLLATKLNDPSITLFVPSSSVSHILLFAKPEDIKTICNVTKSKKPKPPNAHLVLLQLGRSVPFQNKELSQICFALSWNKADGPTGPKRAAGGDSATTTTTSTGGGWRQATMAWRSVLQTSMPNAIFSQVQPTSTTTRTSSSEDDPQQQQQQTQQPFRSYSDPGQSSTTGNMPFVKCYYGVQDGVLYPLEEGLLFFKPAKFIPRSELHSIACGRGGQNASRYVDMHLQLNGNDGDDDDGNNANDDDTKPLVEFTNIQREELVVLNKYIQEVLIPAMKRDVRASNRADKKNTKKTNDDEGADDETEEEVDDVEVVDGDENETDEEESDDDDDENFEEGGSDKEDDEDGNDDSDSDSDDDEDEDEGDECEVVKDDFAQELAKRKKDDSDTESDESGDGSRPKRRRTRGS